MAAQAKFLELLNNPGETWISAFGFTLQPMFDEIKKAMAAGVKVHILLDHSQEVGRAEAPKVQDLVNNLGPGSELVITTAGVNSAKPSQIWHFKAMVVANPGGEDYCWEGSTNFSESAWYQGNSARLFNNNQWASKIIFQQAAHMAWARAHEPQYQLTPGVAPAAPAPVPPAAKAKKVKVTVVKQPTPTT